MSDKKISQLTAATTPLAGTEVLPIVQGSSTVKVAVSDLMKRTFDDFGINTNPSSWGSAFAGLDIGTGGSSMADATSYYQGSNWYYNGASYVYKNNGTAVQSVYSGTGEYVIANAASGTAGNAISFTNRLYMYSEGTLGLKTGNLQLETTGKGIYFGSSSQLNDYETGIWTPKLYLGATEVAGYTTQSGYYTKVGNLVQVTVSINVSSKGAGTGYATIQNFPYTAKSGTNDICIVNAYSGWSGLTAGGAIQGVLGATTMYLVTNSTTGQTLYTDANITNNSVITFSISYIV